MELKLCRLSTKRAILHTDAVDVLFFEGKPIAAKLNQYNFGVYSPQPGGDTQAYLRAREWLSMLDVEKTKSVHQDRLDNVLTWNGAIMIEFENY